MANMSETSSSPASSGGGGSDGGGHGTGLDSFQISDSMLSIVHDVNSLNSDDAYGSLDLYTADGGDDSDDENDDDDDEDEDDDDDDDDYVDAEDGLHEDNDERRSADEEDEEDDDIFGGRPVSFLTQAQLAMLLRGEPLQNVLFGSVARFGPSRHVDPRVSPAFPKPPSEEGKKLMDSGLFGTPARASLFKQVGGGKQRPLPLRLLDRELGLAETMADRRRSGRLIAQSMLPSTEADMVIQYRAPVYLGQFSDDGNFFYCATKDLRVRMYDTANVNEWKHYKTVVHTTGQWTLTDASLSPDNRWLAFSSMMPHVCLAPTDPHDNGDPYLLDLSGRPAQRHGSFATFSIRFSGDGRELVAGTSARSIVVYDIESRTVLHHMVGHHDDVNAVCFGDRSSPHLLYSGSDDATIKVWDRRSLGDGRPAGAFVGHCEGITYIDSKGDGRYILSNGKDQTMRLWDLHMAMSNADFVAKDAGAATRDSNYDYRFQHYHAGLYFKHPHDNSVVTFRDHRVERTLLRCHFSPPGSSDSRYVYSASHSGEVHIWNMDATKAAVVDVRAATNQVFNDALADQRRESGLDSPSARAPIRDNVCVRDASWHPTAPVLVASGFEPRNMSTGTCSMHSTAITAASETGESEHRLFNPEMKPLSGQQALHAMRA